MLSDAQLDEVALLLDENSRCIVSAPPGSGKTTLLPPRLAAAPWLEGQRVLVTGPRRVAVRGAAERMAHLDGSPVGDHIGYSMRGERRMGTNTRIEVMTERLLTRRLQRDPFLDGVGLVILDEFHERSLDADLALALLLDICSDARPDLRVLVMSATLDIAGLRHIVTPVVTVEFDSEPFPLQTVFAPPVADDRLDVHVARVVATELSEGGGDVLVFLPGRREIDDVARHLADRAVSAEVCRLHGGSSSVETERATAVRSSAQPRRVILSTSVAQTSVTIPGVTVVVDAGLERRPRYDPGRGMSKLETVRVSAAAARQRAGRAARLGPGRSIRCWSERDDALLAAQSAPESAHADLTSVALELAAWGVHDPTTLPWSTPLPTGAWNAAVRLLQRLGALDEAGRITAVGQQVVEVGTHPRLATMMVTAPAAQRMTACRVAAAVEGDERGDLRQLVESPSRELRDRARRWARELWPDDAAGGGDRIDDADVGCLLLAAFPERAARRDDDHPERVQLAAGPRVALPSLRESKFLVVGGIHGEASRAMAESFAPIHRDDLFHRVQGELVETDVVVTGRNGIRRVMREPRYGAIPLSGAVAVDDARAEQRCYDDVLASITRDGLPEATDGGRADATLDRLRIVGPFDERLPAVDDAALRGTVAEWLPLHWKFLDGRWDPRSLRRRDIVAGLLAGRPMQLLDELAPLRVEVPTGERITIDYTRDVPTISVKLQSMFGATTGPAIAHGRLPLAVELLSPAGRPLHVTADLAGFWSGVYREVRGEMRGRYPKHHWPEDPLTAPPMTRTIRGRRSK